MTKARFPGYREIHRLRSLGTLEYLAARDAASGEERIIVAGAPGGEGAEIAEVLAAMGRAHQLLDHPWVPPVLEGTPERLVLRSAAVTDAEVVAETARRTGYRFSQEGPPAFAIACLELLEVAHRRIDPATGAPLCLGAFAGANVLIDRDGRVSLLGWGHPHRPAARARLLRAIPSSFVAPEINFGSDPHPGSDLTAATLFFQSFLHLGDLQEEVLSAIRGVTAPGHERLAALVGELFANSQAGRPEDRSVPRFLETFRLVLEELGVVPDAELFGRELAHLAREARGHRRLVVGEGARWFQLDGGAVVRLDRRGPLRRILAALAEAQRAEPNGAVPWEGLFAAGWPGDTASPDSARNRVYVAVAELRSLGLRELLVRRDDGYLFDPGTWVERGE